MKCINCFKEVYSNCNSIDEATSKTKYLRQNFGTSVAPIYQRRVLICEKCGTRVTSLETLENKPIIEIDNKEYNKLKHVYSIVKALGSSRQEAYNIASDIADHFLSIQYNKYYDSLQGDKVVEKVIQITSKELLLFTYSKLKEQHKNSKTKNWGLQPHYDRHYLINHDFSEYSKALEKDGEVK